MKKIAFLTTIFPMKKKYLYDFFDSLDKQTYKDFEIIVVNDGYKDFDTIKTEYSNLKIIELPYSNTIAKNREYGINYVIDNGYDILVFGDSDDYFSKNRIEESLKMLNDCDIVVNDLSLFNENGIFEEKYISNRLPNNTLIKYDYIKDKNIFGLSNTALNLKILNNFSIDTNTIVVDWYLYKRLLKKRYSAIFTNMCITYYRQYADNTIGLNNIDGNYLLWWESNNKDKK